MEEEVKRRSISAQRVLIFAGLVWISLGVAALSGDVSSLIGNPISRPLGIGLIGIGLAHIVVFAIARIQDRNHRTDS